MMSRLLDKLIPSRVEVRKLRVERDQMIHARDRMGKKLKAADEVTKPANQPTRKMARDLEVSRRKVAELEYVIKVLREKWHISSEKESIIVRKLRPLIPNDADFLRICNETNAIPDEVILGRPRS